MLTITNTTQSHSLGVIRAAAAHWRLIPREIVHRNTFFILLKDLHLQLDSKKWLWQNALRRLKTAKKFRFTSRMDVQEEKRWDLQTAVYVLCCLYSERIVGQSSTAWLNPDYFLLEIGSLVGTISDMHCNNFQSLDTHSHVGWLNDSIVYNLWIPSWLPPYANI